MLINKIIGLALIILGFWIVKYFPDIMTYQRKEMTLAGILIGIIFLLTGIGLLIFG